VSKFDLPDKRRHAFVLGPVDPRHGPFMLTTARSNRLVAALPEATCRQWLAELSPVEMRLGDVLHESGRAVSDVYFPTTSIVSLLYTLQNGASTEIAVVGNEGIVGISALMGGDSTPNQSVVRRAGRGYRMPAGRLVSELDRAGPAARLLLRYTQALMTQIAQIAACNRHHSLDQRLCRFLLFSLDRQETRELSMTQELICHMLGVRREGVTEAAFAMQQAGLIRYQRGHISVVDRAALEARSCECYAVIRKEYDRLLSREPAPGIAAPDTPRARWACCP
jgi:CRP-like cAMP-binding protein